jgi:hypothetical protein
LSDYSLEIAIAKYRAVKRAEKRLIQRLEMIDWEYETLRPAVKEIEKAATEGKLPTFELSDGTSNNRK